VADLLFPDFLSNDDSYDRCRAFWRALVDGIEKSLGQVEEWSRWFPAFYGDGLTPFDDRDGNPIYHRLSKRLDRAFQIIQQAPENDALSITAWATDSTNDPLWHDDDPWPRLPRTDLTISLVLSVESAELARALLTQWMTPTTTVDEIRLAIAALPDDPPGEAEQAQ
jgi:hypothetical protein